MFWTAVVWGLGVSLGGAVGMLFFVVMWVILTALMRTKTAKTIAEINELSLTALTRRNELTEKQIEQLGRIASELSRSKSEVI